MSADELSSEERAELEKAQLLVVSDMSKRGVEIGFLSHRAFVASRRSVDIADPVIERDHSETRVAELEAEVEKLRKALSFYARDYSRVEPGDRDSAEAWIERAGKDNGNRAREALELRPIKK